MGGYGGRGYLYLIVYRGGMCVAFVLHKYLNSFKQGYTSYNITYIYSMGAPTDPRQG